MLCIAPTIIRKSEDRIALEKAAEAAFANLRPLRPHWSGHDSGSSKKISSTPAAAVLYFDSGITCREVEGDVRGLAAGAGPLAPRPFLGSCDKCPLRADVVVALPFRGRCRRQFRRDPAPLNGNARSAYSRETYSTLVVPAEYFLDRRSELQKIVDFAPLSMRRLSAGAGYAAGAALMHVADLRFNLFPLRFGNDTSLRTWPAKATGLPLLSSNCQGIAREAIVPKIAANWRLQWRSTIGHDVSAQRGTSASETTYPDCPYRRRIRIRAASVCP